MKKLALTIVSIAFLAACGQSPTSQSTVKDGGVIGDGVGDAALVRFTATLKPGQDLAACTAAVKAIPGIFDLTSGHVPSPGHANDYLWFAAALDSALDQVFHHACVQRVSPSVGGVGIVCFGPTGQPAGCYDYSVTAKADADFYRCAREVAKVSGVFSATILATTNAQEAGKLKFVATKQATLDAVGALACTDHVDLIGPTQDTHH